MTNSETFSLILLTILSLLGITTMIAGFFGLIFTFIISLIGLGKGNSTFFYLSNGLVSGILFWKSISFFWAKLNSTEMPIWIFLILGILTYFVYRVREKNLNSHSLLLMNWETVGYAIFGCIHFLK